MDLDRDACLRAVVSRDERFDGWFYTAVTSTRIYCRPSCPAMTPKAEHLRFYPSAAAAQAGGFRACKRCRPDAAPGSPEWHTRADVVARAMRLMTEGIVDREGVPGLARRLGYSERQLERHLNAELGAGPLALARAQRAQTARVLVETSTLPLTEVAFAAGFASIRTFNDTMREVFATTPTELRSRAVRASGHRGARPGPGGPRTPGGPHGPYDGHDSGASGPVGTRGPGHGGAAPTLAGLVVRLPFRRPLCPDNLFGHLVTTAVPGVEEWDGAAYRTTLRLPSGWGIAALTPRESHIECRLLLSDVRDAAAAIARSRRLLDLDADPVAVDATLAADPALAPLIAAHPGRRVPHTPDPEEFALRAVLGQQVSTAAARTHAARLVAALGEEIVDPEGGLGRLFPAPEKIASLDPEAYDPTVLALPRSRRATVIGLARAITDGRVDLSPGCDRALARERLGAVRGLGPWTIETIAMRALGDPDAFVPTDLGVRRAAHRIGLPATPGALTGRATAWRPWRAYAVQYLWASGRHPINDFPTPGTAPRCDITGPPGAERPLAHDHDPEQA